MDEKKTANTGRVIVKKKSDGGRNRTFLPRLRPPSFAVSKKIFIFDAKYQGYGSNYWKKTGTKGTPSSLSIRCSLKQDLPSR